MESNNSAMKHFSPDAEFKHHLNSAFSYSNNLLEKLIGIVLESDYFDDLVTLILESNADMTNNDLGKTLMDENFISYMHKVADVVPKSEVEKENTSYQMKTRSLREKPDLPKRMLPKLDAEKEENGYVNETLSQIGKQDLPKWKSEVEKENTSYQMKTQSLREKPDLPKRMLPKLDAETEENGYVNGTLSQIGKQDLPKWIMPNLDAAKEENGYVNGTLSQIGKQDLPKWMLPKLDAEKEENGYVNETLSQIGKQDLSKWISTKSEVKKEEKLTFKGYPDFSKSFTHDACNTIIRPNTKFSPSMTDINDVRKESLSQIGKQDLSNWISTKSEIEKEERQSFKGSPDLSKYFSHEACNTIIRPSTNFSPSMTDINDLRKKSSHKAINPNSKFTSSSEVPEHKNDQEHITHKFMQLPKARQELINSYKPSMDKAMESGTNLITSKTNYHREQVGKVLDSGTEMLKKYKEPVDKVIESGSNIINSYKPPVNKVLESSSFMINSYKESGSNMINSYKESGSNMINSYKESGSNMINSYKESGSNIIKQPVKQVLESSSNVLSSKVSSITNSVMNVPAIGKYMPWLFDYGDQEEEE
eukprot:GFUD01018487.1.p1 GENE.GFUD01018487.1~~GFUD01018487.1.p1  ORF type:complete len:623 (-),score=161.52 GFUD01018487.1:155-1927(-)